MKALVIWIAAALMLLGCASTDKSITNGPDAGDKPVASNKYFMPYDTVLQATLKVLDVTGIKVNREESLRAGAVSLWLDIATVPDGKVRRVVVERMADRETVVYLMAEKSFWKPWSSKPDWAKPFFVQIFEVIP